MGSFAEHVEYAFVLVPGYGRVVFDRFHLGTFAYGPVFRPDNDADGIGDFRRAEWDLFEGLIRDHSLLVLCDPGWEAIEENVSTRDGTQAYPEYEGDLAQRLAVYKRFEKGYDFSSLPKRRYDYTQGEVALAELFDTIERTVEWTPVSTRTT